ncbi:MFS transporter [Altericista sp. CCNU0014]|uniref:MFS transporter n=1 Tax=Altericista sp. CCNU0014 TaxID=3082949 RepID=UPI003850BF19
MSTSESQPSDRSGFRALMQNRPFAILWVGQIVSQIADKIFFVLLIDLVIHYQIPTFLANFSKASVMMANTLPAVFLGSAAGIFVDRWSKKQILWSSNLGRGIIIFMIPFLPKQLFFLLIVAVVESVLTQFFAPAEQATIAVLVERKLLMPANALFTTTMMGALVVGFAIGPVLLSWSAAWGGTYGGAILVGGLYVLAAVILALVPVKDDKPIASEHLHPWEDFKQGLRYLRKNRLLSNALVQLTILYSVFAALIALAPGLIETLRIEQGIDVQARDFSFLLSCAGVGLILGAAFLGQWGDRFDRWPLPLIGFLSMGLVLIAFFFAHQLELLLLLSGFLGLGAAFIGVPMQTLIQTQTPPNMRGKVFGVQNNIINIALSFPLSIAALLADITSSVRGVLLSIGILVSIVGIWAWRSTRGMLHDETY